MTTRKTIALTRQTFVTKVKSLLFNMLSRLVIAFLPRSKYLLISWLQICPSKVSQLIYLGLHIDKAIICKCWFYRNVQNFNSKDKNYNCLYNFLMFPKKMELAKDPKDPLLFRKINF